MSDTTDFSIILILLVGFNIYVYYVRKIIDSQYDINNIKCNPVNLFLKSIYAEPSETIDEFAQCVQLLGPKTILEPEETPAPAPTTYVTNAKDAAKLSAELEFGIAGFI
jgi:hypothetical protein